MTGKRNFPSRATEVRYGGRDLIVERGRGCRGRLRRRVFELQRRRLQGSLPDEFDCIIWLLSKGRAEK
ncbi:unnamed protein product [Linum tenue]|uniref:Uncharacterized protein n=1 Tax=Linum tenue TaxID=586396 RepID=A0AAV0K1T6_9ROSI|nr:unnamed protein product [Linum tenue]